MCTASFLCVISFGIADLCTNSQFFFFFFVIMEYCDLCIKAPFLVCCAVDLCMHSFCSLFCFISFGIADLCINNFFFQYGVLRPMCKSTFRCLSKGVVELYINIFFVFNIIGGAVGL